MQADTTQDRTGQLVSGKYRVVKQLGQGSFGQVWLCEQGEIGRKVVIKTLHSQLAQVPSIVERFRREAVATNRVHHGNVCRIYDYAVTEDGVPYIAMEFLSGGTVREEFEKLGPLPVGRVIEIMVPVCEALAAAHQAGIIHRDLKLENIMLTVREGNKVEPVVVDFGIAKLLDAAEKLTQTGSMMGTPTYMSPEQCRGLTQIGPPADVYSVAVMIFELITGKAPFTARTVAELAMKHVLEPPPALPGVPPALANAVATALAKEPEKRPTATALARELKDCLKVGGAQAALAVAPTLRVSKSSAPIDPHSAATVLSPNAGRDLEERLRATGEAPSPLPLAQTPKSGLPVAVIVSVAVAVSLVVVMVLVMLFLR